MNATHSDTSPDDYLVGRIQDAFATDPRVSELGLHVKVAGKKVFVDGQVATHERRDAVSELLSELVPDHEVHNETSVVDVSDSTEAEELS